VYQDGAFSKTIATVSIADGVTIDASKGTKVTGKNIAGGEVVLSLPSDISQGATSVDLQYSQEGCHVGGLVGPQNIVTPLDLTDSADQIWDGCTYIMRDFDLVLVPAAVFISDPRML